MATKSGQQEPEKAEVVEELLDALETSLDRVKVLYEQYFLGIQKQPPTFLHTDIERKIRDLAQLHIRNTALRYRYATLGQKFGSYHSYWRRTLRQIEQGTYTRNLSKIGRQAARTGADVPEEILAAMPKRMREQVRRDREAALANAKRRGKPVTDGAELMTLADEDVEIDVDEFEPAAFVGESSAIRRNVLHAGGVHRIAEQDDEFDVDAFFAKVTSEGDPNPLPIAATPPSGVPVARKRTGSSAHPRPATQSGSSTVAIPRGDRLPSAGAPLEAPVREPAARPAAPIAAQRPSGEQASVKPPAVVAKRPSVQQPSLKPAAPEAATTAIPRAARTVDAAARDVGGAAEAAQTTQLPVQTTQLPVQTTQLPVRPTPPPMPAAAATQAMPRVPVPIKPPLIAPAPLRPPVLGAPLKPAVLAPSQATRPLPVSPGAAARISAQVETMSGPFPRIPSLPPVPAPRSSSGSPPPDFERAAQVAAPRAPTPAIPKIEPLKPAVAARPPAAGPPAPSSAPAQPAARPTPVPPSPAVASPTEAAERAAAPERPTPAPRPKVPRPPSERPTPEPRQAPPPGMSDADVNALYAKYVAAKEILGEQAGPGAYGKLLKTINAQAPKIMEQYKSKGVDFSVVVKDNQVIIRAKPKP